ncbi:peroxisomal sarcosine oxidase isoform X2 [Tachyglossus aculeatus]|uniref:peroxisomal sarcosine oxidase isoform X2 n=1 Tax=Tachyglossus aculeatus TaxID=9261 RepID=UPI0018F492B1|nr:peroxisomal sarcosine oxidase isoform X2 [Tachyglossus aculeatus]
MAVSSAPGRALYDAIVVGAGIQGSFTAYHLAKREKEVLLLEQFPLPHSRGSSHGQTRIIRKVYPEDFYTRMMGQCYQLWAQLEREAGIQLCRQTGLLVLGRAENPEFQALRDSLAQHGITHQALPPEELQRRFPGIRVPGGEEGILEQSGGVLFADKALRALQDAVRQLGGVVRDGEKVLEIEPGFPVTVTTSSGTYHAKNLVITAGPWTNRLLLPLGLQLPLQVCYHHGNEEDPEEPDCPSVTSDIQILSDFVRDYLPGLQPEPAVVDRCMYTNTPDGHFILDRHPTHPNIIIGAGFSGHGFKLSPLVGKFLCELSLGRDPSHDLAPFRISRFCGLGKASL